MFQKCTKAETLKRIRQVETMLIDGASRTEIIGYCRTHFTVGAKATDTYIRQATRVIARSTAAQRADNIHIAIRRYTRLYAKAEAAGDYRSAIAAQKALSELLGLDAAKEHIMLKREKTRDEEGREEAITREIHAILGVQEPQVVPLND